MSARTRLMGAYAELVAFPVNTEALKQLKNMDTSLSICPMVRQDIFDYIEMLYNPIRR